MDDDEEEGSDTMPMVMSILAFVLSLAVFGSHHHDVDPRENLRATF